MKQTSHIWTLVAAAAVSLTLVVGAGPAAAADGTKADYNYRPKSTDPNGNDYHANYHADYSATQDGRPAQPATVEDTRDPRQDSRRFQDGDRYNRTPYGWRR